MPRFSDTEKERIRQKMMQEGERLFTTFGIKRYRLMKSYRRPGLRRGLFIPFIPVKSICIWTLQEACR